MVTGLVADLNVLALLVACDGHHSKPEWDRVHNLVTSTQEILMTSPNEQNIRELTPKELEFVVGGANQYLAFKPQALSFSHLTFGALNPQPLPPNPC